MTENGRAFQASSGGYHAKDDIPFTVNGILSGERSGLLAEVSDERIPDDLALVAPEPHRGCVELVEQTIVHVVGGAANSVVPTLIGWLAASR